MEGTPKISTFKISHPLLLQDRPCITSCSFPRNAFQLLSGLLATRNMFRWLHFIYLTAYAVDSPSKSAMEMSSTDTLNRYLPGEVRIDFSQVWNDTRMWVNRRRDMRQWRHIADIEISFCTVAFSPYSWYLRASLISPASMLFHKGLGKYLLGLECSMDLRGVMIQLGHAFRVTDLYHSLCEGRGSVGRGI